MRDTLSMLIVTKDRQYMLPEIVQYHAQIGITMLIADGSANICAEAGMLQNMGNVVYFHMPDTSFHDRLAFLVYKLTTPFCVIRADRRHQSNNAITQCLHFLQQNPDYVSASGIWCLEGSLLLQSAHDIFTEPWTIDDPVQRVQCHGLSVHSPFYNVHKTSLAKTRVNILQDLLQLTEHTYFLEYIDYFSIFFLGKSIQFPLLGGLIQEATTAQSYHSEYYQTRQFLEDDALVDATYTVVEKHLLKENIDKNVLKKAFYLYIECIRIRFVLYGVTPQEEGKFFTKVARHGYVEKALDMLLGREPEDIPLMKKLLQCAMAYIIDSSFLLGDIGHRFTDIDREEFMALSACVTNIKKRYVLQELREKKAHIKGKIHSDNQQTS